MNTAAQSAAYRLSAMIRVTQAAAEEAESDNSNHLAADIGVQLEAMSEIAGNLIDMIELDDREQPEKPAA